ncbi:trypsin-like peptidase domain-containing protein [soil metagenome]
MKSIRKYAGIFLLAMSGSIAGAALYNYYSSSDTYVYQGNLGQSPVSKVKFTGFAPGTPADFVDAASSSVPSVVHVTTTYANQVSNAPQFFDPFGFFGVPPNQQNSKKPQSTGSGVIISDDGYIVTNNHVVENAEEVSVTLDDKHTFLAKVIGTDPSTDLALLKVDAKNLPYAVYGNSDEVKVGEWVLAVGNPFNLTSTVTAGIVSAKARNINILDKNFPIESFIQTDAAVNPGNSGGALVNTNGELIGINSAIASNTGSYSGYSFAIPVNIVKKVLDDLVKFGTVQRGFIGVSIRDLDADFVKEKDLNTLNGVYVSGLNEGGAASIAGIKEGDVITKINSVDIKSSPELQEQVSRYRPGDKIQVTLLRDDKERTLDVTLRNKNGNTMIVKNEAVDMLGAKLEPLSTTDLKKLGIGGGVKVKELNSGKLRNAGIKEGFIITSIDNKPVTGVDDVSNYLEQKKDGVLIEGIYPNGMRAYYGFGMKD